MEWKDIKDENDIEELMKTYGYFHDGCITEICYNSGMYVTDDLAMTTNDNKAARFVFQRQYNSPKTIEIEFSEIEKIVIVPPGKNYFGLILDSKMFIENDLIHWVDSADWNISKEIDETCTWINAKKVKWRIMD